LGRRVRHFIAQVRATARAAIRREPHILAQLKQRGQDPPYLTIPGGKQEPGEM